MARNYPTYIHYIETEAKSKGEFIVRTVEPKFIVKVIRDGKSYQFSEIEFWDTAYRGILLSDDYTIAEKISEDLNSWYRNRIINKK